MRTVGLGIGYTPVRVLHSHISWLNPKESPVKPYAVLMYSLSIVVVQSQVADLGVINQTNDLVHPIEAPEDPSKASFWKMVGDVIEYRSLDAFNYLLSPSKKLQSEVRFNGDVEKASDSIQGRGQATLARVASRSLQQIVTSTPIWHRLQENQEAVARFLENSLADPDEAEVNPFDVGPRIAEESWFERAKQSRRIEYGVRLFSAHPRVFFGSRFTHHGNLLFLGHVSVFADKAEATIVIPLSHGFNFTTGFAYKWGELGSDKVLVRLSKNVGEGRFFASAFLRDHSTFFAGYNRMW